MTKKSLIVTTMLVGVSLLSGSRALYDRPLWVAGWNPQDSEACRHAFVEIRRAGDRSALDPHLMEYSLGTPRYCDRLGASPDAPPPNGQPPRSRAA